MALYKTTFVVLTDRTDVNAILCYQGNPTSKIPNHLKMLFISCLSFIERLGGRWRQLTLFLVLLFFVYYHFLLTPLESSMPGSILKALVGNGNKADPRAFWNKNLFPLFCSFTDSVVLMRMMVRTWMACLQGVIIILNNIIIIITIVPIMNLDLDSLDFLPYRIWWCGWGWWWGPAGRGQPIQVWRPSSSHEEPGWRACQVS